MPRLILNILLFLLALPLAAQDTEPARYTLVGDDVVIESDGQGGRSLHAGGNVVLTYSFDGADWALSAGSVDLLVAVDADEYIPQVAHAETDITLIGPGVSLTAPGALTVDFLARRLHSESENIHLAFPGGELTTDSLDIQETVTPEDTSVVTIDTARRTVATYDLSALVGEIVPLEENAGRGSLFGSLTFDFLTIAIETERTQLQIENKQLTLLDCPDPAVVTTAANTLYLPAFRMTFDPPTLTATDGIELTIGEETRVEAASLMLTYPPEGGMFIEITGYIAEDHAPPGVPQRVTIYHPAGTFSADSISVRIEPDGSRSVRASGHTMFEMPLGHLLGAAEENQEL